MECRWKMKELEGLSFSVKGTMSSSTRKMLTPIFLNYRLPDEPQLSEFGFA